MYPSESGLAQATMPEYLRFGSHHRLVLLNQPYRVCIVELEDDSTVGMWADCKVEKLRGAKWDRVALYAHEKNDGARFDLYFCCAEFSDATSGHVSFHVPLFVLIA